MPKDGWVDRQEERKTISQNRYNIKYIYIYIYIIFKRLLFRYIGFNFIKPKKSKT